MIALLEMWSLGVDTHAEKFMLHVPEPMEICSWQASCAAGTIASIRSYTERRSDAPRKDEIQPHT